MNLFDFFFVANVGRQTRVETLYSIAKLENNEKKKNSNNNNKNGNRNRKSAKII